MAQATNVSPTLTEKYSARRMLVRACCSISTGVVCGVDQCMMRHSASIMPTTGTPIVSDGGAIRA